MPSCIEYEVFNIEVNYWLAILGAPAVVAPISFRTSLSEPHVVSSLEEVSLFIINYVNVIICTVRVLRLLNHYLSWGPTTSVASY